MSFLLLLLWCFVSVPTLSTFQFNTGGCGPSNDENEICLGGSCCSRDYQCGFTDEFCGEGCRPNYGRCNMDVDVFIDDSYSELSVLSTTSSYTDYTVSSSSTAMMFNNTIITSSTGVFDKNYTSSVDRVEFSYITIMCLSAMIVSCLYS